MAAAICLMPVLPVDAAENGGSGSSLSTGTAAPADQATSYIGNADELYRPLKITGSLMMEEQIFSSSEIAAIKENRSLGLTKTRNYHIDGENIMAEGLDLAEFLSMCGAEVTDDAVIQLFTEDSAHPEKTISVADIKKYGAEAILEPRGSVYLSDSVVFRVTRIIVGTPDNLADPYYGLHLREPLDYMKSMKFTVNFIDQNRYPSADENAEAFKTITYTMEEIEKMMMDHPDQVFGNYFGVSGNEESKTKLGLGGFSDYFEGLSMSWLLSEQAGLKDGEGFAVFYGRDNDKFGTVKDLHYFFPEDGDYSRYYLELTETLSVDHAVPVLAVSKNGYPLLPEHDHEMEGNVDYNTFNHNAAEAGFETKIGLVKNVSGPFVAALANLDGSYGGYRNETSGDCIRIDLYVDASQYSAVGNGGSDSSSNGSGNDDSPNGSGSGNGGQDGAGKYTDVPADSWYTEYINYLSDKGIVNGKTSSIFEPQSSVTRAEFVKMIAGLADADIPKYTGAAAISYENGTDIGTADRFDPSDSLEGSDSDSAAGKTYSISQFDDVKPDSWYAPYVAWAAQKGIVKGVSDSQFHPDGNITRQDMAVILARFADSEGIRLSDGAAAETFKDSADIASYAQTAVTAMQKAGIIGGIGDGSFAPRQNASRSEACKMLTVLAKQMESQR